MKLFDQLDGHENVNLIRSVEEVAEEVNQCSINASDYELG